MVELDRACAYSRHGLPPIEGAHEQRRRESEAEYPLSIPGARSSIRPVVETKWRGFKRADVEGFKALNTDMPGLVDVSADDVRKL